MKYSIKITVARHSYWKLSMIWFFEILKFYFWQTIDSFFNNQFAGRFEMTSEEFSNLLFLGINVKELWVWTELPACLSLFSIIELDRVSPLVWKSLYVSIWYQQCYILQVIYKPIYMVRSNILPKMACICPEGDSNVVPHLSAWLNIHSHLDHSATTAGCSRYILAQCFLNSRNLKKSDKRPWPENQTCPFFGLHQGSALLTFGLKYLFKYWHCQK